MKRRTVKLTPRLIKRLIQEEKARILKERSEKKKSKRTRDKLIIETIRKFLLINKAQKRAGHDFKSLHEQKTKLRIKILKELKNGRN